MPNTAVQFTRYASAVHAGHTEVESLPISQPPGLAAFGGGGSALRFWRHFPTQDLHPGWWPIGMKGVRTLMTADRRDDCWHVCFMEDWEYGGAGVPNSIGHLASAVYREALEQAERRRSARKDLRDRLGRMIPLRRRRMQINASQFRFYKHLPPQGRRKEEFGLARMAFREGLFSSPKWTQFETIPHVIASARHHLMADATLTPFWV